MCLLLDLWCWGWQQDGGERKGKASPDSGRVLRHSSGSVPLAPEGLRASSG